MQYIYDYFVKIQIVQIWSTRFGKGSVATLNDAHNNSKQTQSATEDLNDQNFDERIRVLSISYGTSTPRNSHTDTI